MRSLPYGEDGELTQDWKNRVTRIRKDIKVFTHTLEQEIEEGRRWEAFLTMPDATRLSRIHPADRDTDHGLWHVYQNPTQ